MTATDEQILDAIKSYITKYGYSPSVREICNVVGIKSPGSLKYRLSSMREKGLITYEDKHPRTIRVVG